MEKITNQQLIRSVLALDTSHRGYNSPGLEVGSGVYDFTAARSSSDGDGQLISSIDTSPEDFTEDRTIGFFAQEYVSGARTVIAYRGTDDNFIPGDQSDQVNGFGVGVGKPVEGTLSGIAIWASVSEEVDAKIREQIRAGTFPVRLQSGDWNSGNINWLLDVIAPT